MLLMLAPDLGTKDLVLGSKTWSAVGESGEDGSPGASRGFWTKVRLFGSKTVIISGADDARLPFVNTVSSEVIGFEFLSDVEAPVYHEPDLCVNFFAAPVATGLLPCDDIGLEKLRERLVFVLSASSVSFTCSSR